MMKKSLLYIFCVLFVLVTALPVWADMESEAVPSVVTAETVTTIETAPEESDIAPMQIHPGDQLQVYVFGVEDMTGAFRVDARGVVTLPLIGEINAVGLNKQELESLISAKLIEGEYFNDPKVTIEVIALQPFYILGEVKTPGSYPYTPDLDVFKAIATAGGYTPRAAKEKVTVIRKMDGKKIKIKATEDTPILPGDSIKVDQRFF